MKNKNHKSPHDEPKVSHTKIHVIKIPKLKDKERIIQAERNKQLVIYKRALIDCQLISQQKLCRPEGID